MRKIQFLLPRGHSLTTSKKALTLLPVTPSLERGTTIPQAQVRIQEFPSTASLSLPSQNPSPCPALKHPVFSSLTAMALVQGLTVFFGL